MFRPGFDEQPPGHVAIHPARPFHEMRVFVTLLTPVSQNNELHPKTADFQALNLDPDGPNGAERLVDEYNLGVIVGADGSAERSQHK